MLTSSSPLPIADVELPVTLPFELVALGTTDVEVVDEGIAESDDDDDGVEPTPVLGPVSNEKRDRNSELQMCYFHTCGR